MRQDPLRGGFLHILEDLASDVLKTLSTLHLLTKTIKENKVKSADVVQAAASQEGLPGQAKPQL